MLTDLLPNGSVVRLKGDEGYLMICGRLVMGEDDNGEDTVYQYAGCEFPMGITDDNYFMFDGADIEELLFVGFQDERELLYREKLDELISE